MEWDCGVCERLRTCGGDVSSQTAFQTYMIKALCSFRQVQNMELCDTGAAQIFIRSYEYDLEGGLIGYVDRDYNGDPYTPVGPVSLSFACILGGE